jgi:hypothetical protein
VLIIFRICIMKIQNFLNNVIGIRNPYGLIQKAGKKTRRKFRNKSSNKSRTKSRNKSYKKTHCTK